jgi:hypothetical protein
MKKYSTFLAIKEMQIEATLRFHLTPIRLAIIKKAKARMQRKGTLPLLEECKLVQPLKKSVWRFLKKFKIYLPYDPTIPLLGIYTKECKSVYKRDICLSMFLAALFTTAKL